MTVFHTFLLLAAVALSPLVLAVVWSAWKGVR